MEHIDIARTLAVIAVIAGVTLFTRAMPFLFFSGKKEPPKSVLYLGKVLPPAIMIMLVVYCLKAVEILKYPHGIPEGIACCAVICLHAWKRNNLLSIFGGTILYMVLVQKIFI